VKAKVPAAWPGRALVERAFSASLEAIRADPPKRLWGDRLMITKEPSAHGEPSAHAREGGERLLVGSVVFHGRPDDGVAEVGYGVEESWQRQGIASEATKACVEWALEQDGITAVTATTPPWHVASIRVLERSGLVKIGTEEHDALGEVLRFTRTRA
jgi:RimJ/RimL family protein N-acetyltransferase